jgi:hypothetical protein
MSDLKSEDCFLGKRNDENGLYVKSSRLISVGPLILFVFCNVSSLEDVGLYWFCHYWNVCWIDFTAMSTDYYPRLAGVAHDNKGDCINKSTSRNCLINYHQF